MRDETSEDTEVHFKLFLKLINMKVKGNHSMDFRIQDMFQVHKLR